MLFQCALLQLGETEGPWEHLHLPCIQTDTLGLAPTGMPLLVVLPQMAHLKGTHP